MSAVSSFDCNDKVLCQDPLEECGGRGGGVVSAVLRSTVRSMCDDQILLKGQVMSEATLAGEARCNVRRGKWARWWAEVTMVGHEPRGELRWERMTFAA